MIFSRIFQPAHITYVQFTASGRSYPVDLKFCFLPCCITEWELNPQHQIHTSRGWVAYHSPTPPLELRNNIFLLTIVFASKEIILSNPTMTFFKGLWLCSLLILWQSYSIIITVFDSYVFESDFGIWSQIILHCIGLLWTMILSTLLLIGYWHLNELNNEC